MIQDIIKKNNDIKWLEFTGIFLNKIKYYKNIIISFFFNI